MNSAYAKASQHGGFEPYEIHEGALVCSVAPNDHGYSNYLRSLGYDTANPWQSCANSSIAPNGEIHDGWNLRSARFPAAVSEEHSETAFITRRAIDFITETEDRPWCLHLSYIKPHWPVILHQSLTTICSDPVTYNLWFQIKLSLSILTPSTRRLHNRNIARHSAELMFGKPSFLLIWDWSNK